MSRKNIWKLFYFPVLKKNSTKYFLFKLSVAAHDVYWEIIRLRKNIALARLGLALSS